MKMTQRIAIFAMAALAATVSRAGDSTPFPLDTMDEPLIADSIAVTYDASWIGGDAGATVVISDNGVEVRRTTGAGSFAYLIPANSGRHDLIYTTFIYGVAQEEVYRAAVWSPDMSSVTLVPQGGSGGTESVTATYGREMPSITVPTRTGYTFGGYYTSTGGSGTQYYTASGASARNWDKTADTTLYAKWTANEYTVLFDAKGGAANPASKGVTFDAAYGALPTPVREPYVFVDWRLDGAMVDAETIVTTPSNHVLSARWGIEIGGGIWEETICDEPISLGAPLVAPSGEVVISSEIDGRPVVAIGAEAFAGNTAITSITIPASVTNIADGAFAGCTGIRSVSVTSLYGCEKFAELFPELAETVERVVFLDGVTIIPDNFFEGCTALKAMDIPESVVDIGTNVFEACSALATTEADGLVFYQGWVFGFAEGASPMSQVASLEIPAEYEGAARSESAPSQTEVFPVRGIAAGAFAGEYAIGTLTLPESLVFIGAGAFENCTGLEDIVVRNGVAKIDRRAFRNCTYAQGLALPETLLTIGDGAFENCSMLMGLGLNPGVRDIGSGAFSNCWRAVSVSLPQSVERIGPGAFADCRRIAGVTVPMHVAPMETLFSAAHSNIETIAVASLFDASGAPFAPPETRQMVPDVFKGCTALEGIAMPDWVANVSDGAFEGCGALASVLLPDCVTNIGTRAFADDSSLDAFGFPSSLVSIGGEAFSGCGGIGSLALPDGLRVIGAGAFRGLVKLTRADIPPSVREIGAGGFAGCRSIRAVSIPGDAGTVKAVFPNAYPDITSATVVAEGGAEGAAHALVRDGLFTDCSALSKVELPQNLATIGNRAFSGCSSLSEIGIPATVTNMESLAFANCASLSSIALPKGLCVLKDGLFSNCASLAEIIVPESVVTLGNAVFGGCSNLTRVNYVGNAPAYFTVNGGPYEGIADAAVSYVENGSTGWDGIATSKALPEYWPSGTTHEIAFWTPNRFNVSFDVGYGGIDAGTVGQVTGTSVVLPPEPTRQGARFAGWWTAPENGARVTASTLVTATRPYTVYAHWTMNRYFVYLDPNGGSGEVETVEMTVGTAASLPVCPFSKIAHAFVGWAAEPDGEVLYADGAEVVDLSYANNAAVTLYAVWAERNWTVSDYLDASGLDFETGGDVEWAPDWADSKANGVSLATGTLPPADEGGLSQATLSTTVVGAGTVSFWWKVSCEPEDEDYGEWFDYAEFAIDGEGGGRIAGESGWRKFECRIENAGEHVLEWAFVRDDYDEDGADFENRLWVDDLKWTPTLVTLTFAPGEGANGEIPTGDAPESIVRSEGSSISLPGPGPLSNEPYSFGGWTDGEHVYASRETYVFGSANVTLTAVWSLKTWTMAEAVDAPTLVFATGGNDDWTVEMDAGWTNGVSTKSGAVASGESSWIETTVEGAGTLAFRWKVMGGLFRNTPFAYAKAEIDGESAAQTHLTDGWEGQTIEISGEGTHAVRWTYLRTSARTCDGDCAWLDAVAWKPESAEKPEEVLVDGVAVETSWLDAEAESILAAHGGDYEAAATATAANGVNKVWECYVAGISPTNAAARFEARIEFDAEGKPVMKWTPDLNEGGTKEERVYVVEGKERLGDGWGPTNAASRFFRVKVAMPEE